MDEKAIQIDALVVFFGVVGLIALVGWFYIRYKYKITFMGYVFTRKNKK